MTTAYALRMPTARPASRGRSTPTSMASSSATTGGTRPAATTCGSPAAFAETDGWAERPTGMLAFFAAVGRRPHQDDPQQDDPQQDDPQQDDPLTQEDPR